MFEHMCQLCMAQALYDPSVIGHSSFVRLSGTTLDQRQCLGTHMCQRKTEALYDPPA